MQSPTRRLSHGEFVALIAALFATIALSIDAMLPALPQIAADFSPSQPNNASPPAYQPSGPTSPSQKSSTSIGSDMHTSLWSERDRFNP
jgi:hypothetical protein